jgi:alkylated DNA repair dioxygenase AlkB
VAPHRDRELRHLDETLISIVTLGARRPFLIRPRGGGKSGDISPASGDLLVMGGRTQVGWEHGVPKVKHAGPRISVTWRWSSEKGPVDRT